MTARARDSVSRSARTAKAPGADGTVGTTSVTMIGTGVVPTVTLSRLPRSAPTSLAKRSETATGTGPGSGKAVATRVRAASSAPPSSTVAAIRSEVPVGAPDNVTVGSRTLFGIGGADVAVQSDPSVDLSADPAGGMVSVTATATGPAVTVSGPAVTGRATATRRSPSAAAQSGS